MVPQRVFSVLAALILTVSVTVGTHGAEKRSLKIGAVFSLTGKASALGNPEQKTVHMIMEEINRAGGINGYPLEIVFEDDQTLESAAVAAVKKFIEKDGVLAIVGPSTSGSSLAVKPICEQAKVPLISCAAAEAIVTPPEDSRYIFKTPQLDSHVAIRILEEIKSRGITKVAILSDSTPFGQQGRKQLEHFAQQMGVKLVADESFALNATDMTPELQKAVSSGAEAIVNWSLIPTQTIVPRNMAKLGIKVPLFHSHGFGNPAFLKIAGDVCEGIIFPAGPLLVVDDLPDTHLQKQVLTAYKVAYEKRYGPVSTFGGHAYDAIWITVGAIKAKNITPDMPVAKAREMIRDGIEATRGWVGTAGVFNMTSTDHTGLDKDQSLEMLVVKGGRFVPLAK